MGAVCRSVHSTAVWWLISEWVISKMNLFVLSVCSKSGILFSSMMVFISNFRWFSKHEQNIKKWISSSTIPGKNGQKRIGFHVIFFMSTFSIINLWLDNRNFENIILSLIFFILSRYCSLPTWLTITIGWEYWALSLGLVTGHCRVIVSDNVSQIRSVVLNVCA